MDLAPVLDLSDSPGPNPEYPDGPRSFSVDPTVATEYGIAFAEGLLAAGIAPVVKHFPGLGQATANTDFRPATVPALSVLEGAALAPFRDAIDARLPAVMVSNASVPGLTAGLPASLSSAAITGFLRQQLGFGGLVITDSLSAQAITDAGYSEATSAVLAVEAGADMVLFNNNTPETTTAQIIASIDAAVTSGQLAEARLDQAVDAVLTVKGVNLCP